MEIIRISNLSVFYDEVETLKNINLEISKNEIVGFVGKNGSGKSTILTTILAINNFSGTIKVKNIDINKNSNFKKYIGYIPENVEIFSGFTGEQYIKYIASFRGIRNFKEREDFLVNILGLKSIYKCCVSKYSKGSIQKLSIISALIHKPELLIMDEPFDGLDVESQKIFIKLLKDFYEDGGTILFSCHSQKYIGELCTRIIYLNNGNIVNDISKSNNNFDSKLKENIEANNEKTF